MVLLVFAAVAAIVVYLPMGEVQPIDREEQGESNVPEVAASADVEDELLSPFKDSQLERARARAQETLDRFSAMQDHVEVNMLGSHEVNTRYRSILDRADQGDIYFADRAFDQALEAYEVATEELQAYITDMDRRFDELMVAANEKLDERDEDAARQLFNEAGDVKPLDVQVQAGLRRVQLLPEVNRLLRESRRAVLREEWREAASFLEQARNKDPLTKGLASLGQEIQEAIRERDFNDKISRAHAALAAGDFNGAESLFNEALQETPESSAAQTGLQQTARARTRSQIEQLRLDALEREARLDMEGALTLYDQALEIDRSLQFARDGRQRVIAIVSVMRSMNRFMSDPGILSSDEEFTAAQEVLTTAEEHRNFSADYDELLGNFSTLLQEAAIELPLVLLSDNATEISVTTVGVLGVFERHEVLLRPGRYEIVGSSDGCVDVRKTITVRPGMEPISVVCDDPI